MIAKVPMVGRVGFSGYEATAPPQTITRSAKHSPGFEKELCSSVHQGGIVSPTHKGMMEAVLRKDREGKERKARVQGRHTVKEAE